MKYFYDGIEYTVDYIAHNENDIDVFLVNDRTDDKLWLSDLPTGVQKEVFAIVEKDLPTYMDEYDVAQDITSDPQEEPVIWRPGDDV